MSREPTQSERPLRVINMIVICIDDDLCRPPSLRTTNHALAPVLIWTIVFHTPRCEATSEWGTFIFPRQVQPPLEFLPTLISSTPSSPSYLQRPTVETVIWRDVRPSVALFTNLQFESYGEICPRCFRCGIFWLRRTPRFPLTTFQPLNTTFWSTFRR